MKSYIIYLPQYKTSVDWANHALSSGLLHKWNIELFTGVDGRSVSDNKDWNQYNVTINRTDSKCAKLMDRSGVRGCFLSHYTLWQQCVKSNQPIGIFEHDIEFLKEPPNFNSTDLLKLEGFTLNKARPAGAWYEGARAYIITPAGAKKLINWIGANGCLPADVVIGDSVVKIDLDLDQRVRSINQPTSRKERHTNSFTWNLEGMV